MRVQLRFNQEQLIEMLRENIATMGNIPDGFWPDDDKCKLSLNFSVADGVSMIVEYEGEAQ